MQASKPAISRFFKPFWECEIQAPALHFGALLTWNSALQLPFQDV
jgi:hypothetical protein